MAPRRRVANESFREVSIISSGVGVDFGVLRPRQAALSEELGILGDQAPALALSHEHSVHMSRGDSDLFGEDAGAGKAGYGAKRTASFSGIGFAGVVFRRHIYPSVNALE